jgi:YbgC/YbaW family acyl-CoA thioester hydrolase
MPSVHVVLRVPFVDVDQSRRIHYTAMFRYMELAEHELMRSLGIPFTRLFDEFEAPRVHVSCEYRAPLRYDDWLDVEARITRVGRTSWTMDFLMHALPAQDSRVEEGVCVAEGQMIVVLTNRHTQRPTPLPDDVRRALAPADTPPGFQNSL